MNSRNSTLIGTILALLFAVSGQAMAQDPGACTGDVTVDGRIEQIIDTSDGHIYAVGEGGTYWSCDNGLTWSGGGQGQGALSIIRDPRDSTKVIVGHNASYNSNYGIGDMPDGAWSLVARQGGTLLAGGTYGIWMSTDFGEHWTPISGTESSGPVRALLVDPNNDLHILASSRLESFRSLDGGLTWDAFTSGVPSDVSDFAVDPANSSVFYATAEQWILRSSDSGYSWQQSKYAVAKDIAFDPGNPLKAYFASSGGNIAYSIDGAQSWSYLFDEWTLFRPYAHSMYVAPNGRVLTGTVGDGIFYSNDGGSSWVKSVAADPNSPPVNDPSSGLADLRASISTGTDSVSAGSNVNMTITVHNYGPDDSTNTTIGLSWVEDGPLGNLDPGFSSSSSNPLCCNKFTVPAGSSVTINVIGSTEANNYADYTLYVTTSNAQSPVERTETLTITATTPVVCGLLYCWEAPSGGGGSMGLPVLLFLLSVLALRRRPHA